MHNSQTGTITIDPIILPGGWVVGGYSRLLDSWTPTLSMMYAPGFYFPKYEFSASVDAGTCSKPKVKKLHHRIYSKLFRRYHNSESHKLPDSKIYYDVRHDTQINVAHILQQQIGIALASLEILKISNRYKDLVFIINSKTPSYAKNLFQIMGFSVLETEGQVFGTRLCPSLTKFIFRATSAKYLRLHAVRIGLLKDEPCMEAPIFLARRNRRTIKNIDDISKTLSEFGYRTVFAEDLEVEQQITTIAQASNIVGLHGAAMGYAMFRNPDHHGCIVECFPCGFATNWVRQICHAVGDTWVGCQGTMEGKVIEGVLSGAHAQKFEARNYHIELDALRTALSIVDAVSKGANDNEIASIIYKRQSITLCIP